MTSVASSKSKKREKPRKRITRAATIRTGTTKREPAAQPPTKRAPRQRREKRSYKPRDHRVSILRPLSTAGAVVTPDTAITLSAVFSGVRLISETFGCLPAHVFQRNTDTAGTRIAAEHPLTDRLLYAPNPEMTSQAFFETLESHALFRGNAYAEIAFAQHGGPNGGAPVALWPLPPTTQPKRTRNGELYYSVPLPGGGHQPLARHSVIHIPGLGFDGIKGYPIVEMLKETFGLGLATNESAARFFGDGMQIGGVLEHPEELSDEAAERLKTWRAENSGLSNAHRIAILEEGMKYNPIGVAPDQAQFLETRKFQVIEIARILRIPPHLLYDLDRATFSNIEEQGIDFVTYTLTPWLRRWELELRRKLFNSLELRQGYYVKFNPAALLRGDTTKRYAAYAVALNNGWLNVDEVRALEDLPPLPGGAGAVYRHPSTMQPSNNGTPNNANP
jgi:HK97 family phage portal protein